jgi:predicted RNA-binding protein with TRAM domain
MEISEDLLCLFNAELEATDDGYAVEVPRREVESGSVAVGEVYRVALVGHRQSTDAEGDAPSDPQPPVEEGEIRYVEIEDIGKQGDGIARVERGYVTIVPDTEVGDRVKVEVREVKSNFAVADVVEEA